MSPDVIISVEGLSNRYRLGQIGATTLRESFERWWHRVCGRDPHETWAFVVAETEWVGYSLLGVGIMR